MKPKRPQYFGFDAAPTTAYVPPTYTLRPPETCSFTAASNRHAQTEAILTRPVNPPSLMCTASRTIGAVDWTVALYSDDTVRIVTDNATVATGRFVNDSHVTAWGSLSVKSRIVDLMPAAVVSADIVESLAGDLTYFAVRGGRFTHCHEKKAQS